MEAFKIFKDDRGKELFSYTVRGESEGEEQATRERLAHENGLDPSRITVFIDTQADGTYYYLECMNAHVNGLYPVSDFQSDQEAIRTAADYEATLYRQEYIKGELKATSVLYDPSAF